MKKSDLLKLGAHAINAVGAVSTLAPIGTSLVGAGLALSVASLDAAASATDCADTAVTAAGIVPTCQVASGAVLATSFGFTGSAGVAISYDQGSNTAGVPVFAACARHLTGTTKYGLTTSGGSMQATQTSATAVAADLNSGCTQ